MSRCVPVTGPLPAMKDLSTDNITENVILTNNQTSDPRMRYLFERLISHMHDFARETQLTSDEWIGALEFLTRTGKASTDLRNEMMLLSDTLGLSALVDSINHPKTEDATEGTVLGPFHTHDANSVEHGAVLHTDPDATKLLVVCTIKDRAAKPIPGVRVDVWEGDSHGIYDVQRDDRNGPDGRAVLKSDDNGDFHFQAIVPVPYPIPGDGPVGGMLQLLGRHPNRPGHVHFMFAKEGWDPLITALYPRGDPYESTDPVFGVKESLMVNITDVDDAKMAEKYNVPVGTKLLKYDFVMVREDEALALREKNAAKNMKYAGDTKLSFVDGKLVPASA